MTQDEIIKLLCNYQELKYNLMFYENKMLGLKAITYTSEEKGSVLTEVSPINMYIEKAENTREMMHYTEELIENNLTGVYRTILWYKYIEGYTYRMMSKLTNYSERHIRRLRKEAIVKLSKDVLKCPPNSTYNGSMEKL